MTWRPWLRSRGRLARIRALAARVVGKKTGPSAKASGRRAGSGGKSVSAVSAALQQRIEACHRLWGQATDPETSLNLWHELQGLLVASGQRDPMTGLAPGPLFDAYERGLQAGHTLTRLEGTHGDAETT
jgi:hypothetical protein